MMPMDWANEGDDGSGGTWGARLVDDQLAWASVVGEAGRDDVGLLQLLNDVPLSLALLREECLLTSDQAG